MRNLFALTSTPKSLVDRALGQLCPHELINLLRFFPKVLNRVDSLPPTRTSAQLRSSRSMDKCYVYNALS